MNRLLPRFALFGLILAMATAPLAWGQRRPHIGYTYPAGGQVATTFQIKLGGQDLDDVNAVLVTGTGVSARVVDYYRRLNNQEIQLLNEQLKELRKKIGPAPKAGEKPPVVLPENAEAEALAARIERRTKEWVQQPACASIASLVFVEVTVAPDAVPGVRELRLVTPRGVSNPLAFHVGQVAEYARKAMGTAIIQILGKESQALRKRPPEETEVRVAIPCTVNGQIASGEVNRYRFAASKGQRIVISTQARQLIPYIADAVPGWFQPVLALHDAQGREVAYADDFRFKPDPVIVFEVPRDGDYVFSIHDSIFRGREDFVYRITVGELPFVTSLFPLGGQVGAALTPGIEGVNVVDADIAMPASGNRPGVLNLVASRMGYRANPVPYVLDTLPDGFEQEAGNAAKAAQPVTLPVVVNGRIDRPDDWDVYQFTGKANERVVVEVQARRLESPLDSVVKLTDAAGKVIAFNDDAEDLTAGTNTHHADSYLTAKLPANGTYQVHVGDTARKGGPEYGYRLRISAPQPEFELRLVPSSVSLPLNSTTALTVYVARKDGFTGPVKLVLKDPPPGFTAPAVTIPANQAVARFTIKGGTVTANGPVALTIAGSAKVGEREVVRDAVPAEDRMQAFLWRHLVPASDLRAVVYDARRQPEAKRVLPTIAPSVAASATPPTPAATKASNAPKFTKQQITGRLRQLKLLYEDNLLSDEFYAAKVAECETSS